jgi:hypothetical protein
MLALVGEYRWKMIVLVADLAEGTTYLVNALTRSPMPSGTETIGSARQLLGSYRLGLDAACTSAVISGVVGLRKPDAEISSLAAQSTIKTPVNIFSVNVHPETDIVGAAGDGSQPASIKRGREWLCHLATAHPGCVTHSLAGPLSLVGTVHRGGDDRCSTIHI